MFSTFTKKSGGALIIRSQDMRSLEDEQDACTVVWEPSTGNLSYCAIQGTAQENLDRLKAEELKLLEQSQIAQQRAKQGYAPIPITRGKR